MRTDMRGAAQGSENLFLRLGAEPGAALGDAQAIGLRLQDLRQIAAADTPVPTSARNSASDR